MTLSTLTPRPHQGDALRAATEAVDAGQRRLVLHLAAGAGKTLIGRWLAERLASQLTLVVVPSLALMAQTVAEWRSAAGVFTAHIVCSDPSTAAGDKEGAGGGVDPGLWEQYTADVTTDPAKLARRLRFRGPSTVVFSTYHSLPTVAAALRTVGERVDLMVCDEAHHLAGDPGHAFRTALDDEQLAARVRVFMTATPIVASDGAAVSMDDPNLFGRTVYRLDFAEAIRRGILSDFRVLIYQASGSNTPDPLSALFVAASEGLSRVLTFHGRVAKARAFAQAADGAQLPDGRHVRAYAVSAEDNAARRAHVLEQLEECRNDEMVVVASAQCLSEGVNIPSVDGVMFADPKGTAVGAVQAVGRALRRSPGKSHGVILLPVCISDTFDTDTALTSTPYRQVWKTLRALRTLDTTIVTELAARASSPGRARGPQNPRIEFRVPDAERIAALAVRAVDFTFQDWDAYFAELVVFADAHGRAAPPRGTRLGEWAERQRVTYRADMLDAVKADRLESLAGWVWDLSKHTWFEQLQQVRVVCADGIDVHDERAMSTRLHLRSVRSGITTVGRWLAAQRVDARAGQLDEWRRRCLNNSAGWCEHEVDPRHRQGLDLLGEYVAWKRHANPEHSCVEDDFPLGRWVNELRRARITGQLPLPLLHELEVLTPRSGDGAFKWFSNNVRWMLSLEALHQFVSREGHCNVPYMHVEALTDIDIPLSVWCRNVRHARRTGALEESRQRMLEQVAGWQWEIQAPEHVVRDIGADRHGTRAGYAAGCKCEDCCAANLADHRRREQLAAAGLPNTDLVDAGPARVRIRMLCGQGAPMKCIARAAGLNVKTITEIESGETRRILPDTDRIVRALTLEHVNKHGQPGTRICADATWRLLDDMIARGWPRSWIARELGLGTALQLKRTTVTAANARRVAELDRRLGRRLPPPRQWRAGIPALGEIIASETSAA